MIHPSGSIHTPVTARTSSEVSTGTRSFIVSLAEDSDASRSQRSRWHARVTSVPSGDYVYARKIDEIPMLLACQIDKSGIPLGWYWRMRVRLHNWRGAFKPKK